MTDYVIYKYTLPSEAGVHNIETPPRAVILHVASVNDVVCLWARVEPDNATVQRMILVVDTGKKIVAKILGEHVGTAVTLNGRLVWHVFDLGIAP